MIKRLAQVCGASAVVWSLGMGLMSAVYQPPQASAQDEVTCYVCACQGGRCICQQVACP